MKSLHILPDESGNIQVYQQFWNEDLISPLPKTAPALLIYGDLMASGVERNIETAQKIYDEIIAAQF